MASFLGLPPFYSHDTQEIYNSILTENINFPNYVSTSPELKDLINKLLEKDPINRLGCQEGILDILRHKWF
jgi:serum/glucocorticoid-regulated kinase 2